MVSDLKISVITPSYNQGPFLEQTLRSVHDQGYPHIEHVVIDGGSSDESTEILQRWSNRLSHWVSEPDAGQTDALIKGFEHATGDIHCWLNSDDLFEPWTFREVATFFDTYPDAQVVYGDATWIDGEGRRLHTKNEHPFNRFIFMYDHDFIPQPSTFWRSGLYQRVGGLDPAFDLAMDADLFIRFADVTRIHHVRRPWSQMRLYPEQKNQRLRLQSNLEDGVIRDRYVGSNPLWLTKGKRAAARAMRITWKLVTGCYSLTDLRSWIPGLSSRQL
jgi:glycosyltransferase involved in cell wall biosynthesis